MAAALVGSSKDIAPQAVKNSDVQKSALKSNRLKDGKAVGGVDVIDDSLTGDDVDESTLNLAAGGGAPTGPAGGGLAGTYPNPTIGPDSVGSNQVIVDSLAAVDLAVDSVGSSEIANDAVGTTEIANDAVNSAKIANDAVGSTEIAADSVGSSEIAPGVVGADELDSVHEHTGTATNVVDTTAHDGSYGYATKTVSCGSGEDLLSVTIDWSDDNLHNETVFGGVDTINRGVNPQTATVRASFDGGGGAGDPAVFQPVATCIS